MDGKHELGFLIWSNRAIQDSITECWNEHAAATEIARAQSDWLLLSLYTGVFGCRHLTHDPDPASERFDLIGLDWSGTSAGGGKLF
jgi:hypothetical protein